MVGMAMVMTTPRMATTTRSSIRVKAWSAPRVQAHLPAPESHFRPFVEIFVRTFVRRIRGSAGFQPASPGASIVAEAGGLGTRTRDACVTRRAVHCLRTDAGTKASTEFATKFATKELEGASALAALARAWG